VKVRTQLISAIFFVTASSVILLILINTDYFDTQPIMSINTDAIYLDSEASNEARVADLLSYMTLEEKIGQMALVEKNSIKNISDIGDFNLGALLSGSGAKPEENTVSGWKKMTDTYQTEATKSRLGIPLLYGSDAIHGHAHVPEATVFPHMIGLGATGNPELVRKIAAATANEMLATGVNWNFAPNLDTPQDIRWGRVYETFSDDPDLVSQLGAAFVDGLQSSGQYRVLSTPKHFVGLGGMGWNTSLNTNFKIDQGVTPADDALLQEVYLPPFAAAVDAGALSVMVGLNTWGDKRTVRQKYLLTDVLKKQLGFRGFIVSDWYGVHEGTRSSFLATVSAINAGVDMVMLPFDYEMFIRHMKWANRLGLISDTRIDDAVSRILYAKVSLGLFDANVRNQPTADIPNKTHHTLARTAVSESLVLLRNEDSLLPIDTTTNRIRVAGSAADNVGKQMGAWSIEWQGIDGNWPSDSTSILAGIKEVAGPRTRIEYEKTGVFASDTTKAEIGIAVVGESPYAEGWGDNPSPTLSAEDMDAIKNLQQSSDAVVVILVTGRPLIITDEIDNWDAVVTAWLPGSEGAGVADVLFGKQDFTGTLPLHWPAQLEQLPISADGKTRDGSAVLFPRYFGLKY
jgi:beta-glucosidase